ncbi:MAG: lytic transglycosylase [Mesorhizobium amorphae]|nr:MAG: lytic transglycosylase [Mesorhizobium amorphae]
MALEGAPVSNYSATGAIAAAPLRPNAPIAPLKAGLDALADGRIADALALRTGLDALDRKVLSWAIATQGGARVPSGEIALAAQELANWPGAMTLRRNSERSMATEKPPAPLVIESFSGSTPQTVEGTILLTRALLVAGQAEEAHALLGPFWRTEKLEANQEAAISREFGAILTQADHRARMERMLYADRVTSAARVAELAGAKPLADAWGAVIRNEKTARAKLDAVPQALRGAGFLFAEARLLRRQDKHEEAAAVMLAAPTDAASLVNPDAWWIERRALSRGLVDRGDVPTAYRLVAAHSAESPSNKADAEFHAGWYALTGLKDAKTAARHFARITQDASGAISLSRGFYWQGRAAEAGGGGDAKALFAKAAHFGTTFYGQLAASRLGQKAIAVSAPEPTPQDRVRFAAREAARGIARLEEAGQPRLATALTRDLAESLESPGELALLTERLTGEGNHYLALRLGKAAAARGLEVGALSHPLGAIPTSAEMGVAGTALAYAIARQESEFNTGAVSNAGARGLLQLLPSTARDVARKAGLPFSQARLTTDPGYNATLGTAFLSEQLARFDGSYVLTFAGYNAGPGRAREWIRRYGDPRGQDVDAVVDWIERIPFAETRAYVQRVMENYQVYKMRISGEADIATDLVSGRRGG